MDFITSKQLQNIVNEAAALDAPTSIGCVVDLIRLSTGTPNGYIRIPVYVLKMEALDNFVVSLDYAVNIASRRDIGIAVIERNTDVVTIEHDGTTVFALLDESEHVDRLLKGIAAPVPPKSSHRHLSVVK